jgi:hypothetical protein
MKKVISIVLSLILIVSHISFVIGTHYCGGEAVESKVMFEKTHLGCGMMDMDLSCDETGKTNNHDVTIEKIPCCENEFHTIQTTGEFVKNTTPVTFSVDFAIAFIYATANIDLLPNSAPQSFTDFSPPPLEKDIQVLFQTFLI